jgi:hypothetical protein
MIQANLVNLRNAFRYVPSCTDFRRFYGSVPDAEPRPSRRPVPLHARRKAPSLVKTRGVPREALAPKTHSITFRRKAPLVAGLVIPAVTVGWRQALALEWLQGLALGWLQGLALGWLQGLALRESARERKACLAVKARHPAFLVCTSRCRPSRCIQPLQCTRPDSDLCRQTHVWIRPSALHRNHLV